MTDEELAELRALQARAYGVEGGLVGAELARLRDLERLNRVLRGRPALPRPTPSPQPVPARSPHPLPELVEGEAASPAVHPSGDGPESRWRRTAVVASITGAVMLAVGIAIGAAVFAPTRTTIELTAEQQKLQQEIVDSDEFDPGSVHVVGTQDGVTAWTASMHADSMRCIVLGAGTEWTQSCSPLETALRNGLFGSIEIQREDGTYASVQVLAAFTADEVAGVSFNQYSTEVPIPTFTDEQEEADYNALIAEGFLPGTPWAISRYLDRAVWVGDHSTEGQCLAYVGERIGLVYDCVPRGSLEPFGLTLPAEGSDVGVRFEYSPQSEGAPALSITHPDTGQSIGTGDQVDQVPGEVLTGP